VNMRNLLIVVAGVVVALIAYDTVVGPALASLMAPAGGPGAKKDA
jgi:hypothetical protein